MSNEHGMSALFYKLSIPYNLWHNIIIFDTCLLGAIMKAKLFTAIISTSLILSACGGSHNNPKAVDKLEEAEANALAKAPKAEEVKFDDHGQPTMGGVGGAAVTNTNTAPTAEHVVSDLATTDAQTLAHDGQAANNSAAEPTSAPTDATASTAPATTEAPKADNAADTPAETATK